MISFKAKKWLIIDPRTKFTFPNYILVNVFASLLLTPPATPEYWDCQTNQYISQLHLIILLYSTWVTNFNKSESCVGSFSTFEIWPTMKLWNYEPQNIPNSLHLFHGYRNELKTSEWTNKGNSNIITEGCHPTEKFMWLVFTAFPVIFKQIKNAIECSYLLPYHESFAFAD